MDQYRDPNKLYAETHSLTPGVKNVNGAAADNISVRNWVKGMMLIV